MVSSDEIRSKLEARRTGQDPEDIENSSIMGGGYLVCEQCGSYYELQPGESPEDFSPECDCGGNLIYQDSFGGYYQKRTFKSNSSSSILIVVLGLGIVIFFVIRILPILYLTSMYTMFSIGDSSPGIYFVLFLVLVLVFSFFYTAYHLIKVILRANK